MCGYLSKYKIYFMFFRMVKEQLGDGKSQETLDSVGLQSSSEKGAGEQEETTKEGKYSSRPKMAPFSLHL